MIRALIYKDLTVLLKQSKFLLIFMLLFLVGGVFTGNQLMIIYPATAVSVLSLNSISFDEKSGWERYADALPYGRKRIVSSKYLLSLLCLGAAILLLVAASLVAGAVQGGLNTEHLLLSLRRLFLLGSVYSALMLPIVLRFGMEKSRILYLLVICGALVGMMTLSDLPGLQLPLSGGPLTLALLILCAAMWLISWPISLRLYQKKAL